MIKLLLADDEPLVLVGLQSMLKWEELDVEICCTARNGAQALDLIEKEAPDLVICDIRMPVRSGLDVLRECRERYGRLPLFIMLTSYEEFQYVKQAIRLQAVDYLVKIELTPETLEQAVSKALALLREFKKEDSARPRTAPAEQYGMQPFHDRFFVRLFHSLFENEEQFLLQKEDLGVDFSFDAYAVCYCEMTNLKADKMQPEHLVNLYSSTTRMVWETVTKYMACYVTSLDMRHFNITFCLSEQESPIYQQVLRDVLEKTIAIIHGYFNVQLSCCVGCKVRRPLLIGDSYYTARQALHARQEEDTIQFYDGNNGDGAQAFDFSRYKESLSKSFQELDAQALEETVSRIISDIQKNPANCVQAMDAASNLVFMVSSLLYDGEQILSQIFAGDEEGYRGLYRLRSSEAIAQWMAALLDGLLATLRERKKNYRDRVVENVKSYIRANLHKRLSLNEVAAVFGFSPNYMSQLFAKNAGCNFVEYITNEKIAAAKEMLQAGDAKIYEIAQALGFENAFYFSKVFKKVAGCSPRDYQQSNG